jgi:hypothetical protein
MPNCNKNKENVEKIKESSKEPRKNPIIKNQGHQCILELLICNN